MISVIGTTRRQVIGVAGTVSPMVYELHVSDPSELTGNVLTITNLGVITCGVGSIAHTDAYAKIYEWTGERWADFDEE